MVIRVLGEFPTKVVVTAHAHIPEIQAINDHDTVVATLFFSSGTLGIINVSRHSNCGHDQRLEVFDPKEMATATIEQSIYNIETQYGLNDPRTTLIWYNSASRYCNAHQREMEHFLDIGEGLQVSWIVHYKNTMAVSKIVTACEELARSGKMVELVWAEDELPNFCNFV